MRKKYEPDDLFSWFYKQNKTKKKKRLFSLFIRNVIEMYVAKKLPHDVSVLPCDF